MKKQLKLTIGLTGGIGSGKTTVSDMFATLGVHIVDADVIARQVVQPGSNALNDIIRHFGHDILLKDESLDRHKLRRIVFDQSEEKNWLENLLHPLIRTQIDQQIQQASSPYVILVAPLLLEGDLWKSVDRILVIDIPIECQINRVMTRDMVNKEQVQAIIDTQISTQKRLEMADDIIHNDKHVEQLQQQVLLLHQSYLNLIKQG